MYKAAEGPISLLQVSVYNDVMIFFETESLISKMYIYDLDGTEVKTISRFIDKDGNRDGNEEYQPPQNDSPPGIVRYDAVVHRIRRNVDRNHARYKNHNDKIKGAHRRYSRNDAQQIVGEKRE